MNAPSAKAGTHFSFAEALVGHEGMVALASAFIFFKDFFIMVAGVHTELIGIAILASMALYTIFKDRQQASLPGRHVVLILSIAFIAGLSSLNTGSLNSSSYFASFFVATCIATISPRYFARSMTALMALNLALQFGELLAGQFLFVYVDEEYEYDEKMLGVGDGSFRAKGLFGSPLNAISIVMSLAFLNPRSIHNWILLILTSSLGQGRLGLGVGIIGLLLSLIYNAQTNEQNGNMYFKKFAVAVVTITGALALFVFFGSEESISRLLEASSSENSQNASRLLIWGMSIEELINYDALSLLVGKYGHIKNLIGGTESDWLRLWLDNGLIFMLLYLVPLLIGGGRSIAQKFWPESFAYMSLILVMNLYPHGQSMPNGTMVWLTIFVTMYRHHHIIDSNLTSPQRTRSA